MFSTPILKFVKPFTLVMWAEVTPCTQRCVWVNNGEKGSSVPMTHEGNADMLYAVVHVHSHPDVAGGHVCRGLNNI